MLEGEYRYAFRNTCRYRIIGVIRYAEWGNVLGLFGYSRINRNFIINASFADETEDDVVVEPELDSVRKQSVCFDIGFSDCTIRILYCYIMVVAEVELYSVACNWYTRDVTRCTISICGDSAGYNHVTELMMYCIISGEMHKKEKTDNYRIKNRYKRILFFYLSLHFGWLYQRICKNATGLYFSKVKKCVGVCVLFWSWRVILYEKQCILGYCYAAAVGLYH